MQDVFFGLGKFMESTFDWLLVPFSHGLMFGIANVLIALLIFFGILYWLSLQGNYSRKALRDNTYI
jgi:hypothetical protein